MQKISFPDYSSMASYIYEKAQEGKYVYTVLFYDDAKEILKELSLFEDTEFEFIELRAPDWSGYTKEFYLVLDPQMHISCEEAWHEANEYHDACYYRFGDDDVVALIDGDASSLILDAAGTSQCIEIEIDRDIDNDCDCCEDCDECIELTIEDIIDIIFDFIFGDTEDEEE